MVFMSCVGLKQDIKVFAASDEKLIIRAYGDSIAYGYGLSDKTKAYPSIFASNYSKFNGQFISKAVSGDKTSDLLSDLSVYQNGTASDMASFEDTDIIVLCIGANNVLGPALNKISGFLTGSVTEEAYQTLLDQGVAQFKADYPQILQAFSGKQIYIMTVFNPYKYLTLNDITLDSSVSLYQGIIKSFLSSYETKLQKMLQMSIDSLKIINNEILKSQSSSVEVIDIYSKFETFTKSQYLQYINADISKVVIDSTMVQSILKKDFSALSNEIMNNCDPHPTIKGHEIIAQQHSLNEVSLFNMATSKSLDSVSKNDVISFKIGPKLQGNFNYKLFIGEGVNKKLICESSNNMFEVEATNLQGLGNVYVEVYNNNEKVVETNMINVNINFQEDVQPQPQPQDNQEKKSSGIGLYVLLIAGAPTATVFIVLIIKSRRKTDIW